MWVFIREESKNVIVIRKVSLLLTIKQESQSLHCWNDDLCTLLKPVLSAWGITITSVDLFQKEQERVTYFFFFSLTYFNIFS